MIRLFTSSFASPDPARRNEYAEAMRRNLACRAIDAVYVFDEGSPDLPKGNPKLTSRDVRQRPTYADYFAWINELAGPDDISILANADIYFDDQLALFTHWSPPAATVFALARWEPDADGRVSLRDRNDSQDAWIFRGPVRRFDSDFRVGVPGCDNRLASELERAGYQLRNPSFSLRSYHLHAGDRPPYIGEARVGGVSPPYGYVWPHNLWPLHKTLIHNLRHPSARAGWRIDRRLWKKRLKVHWIQKGWKKLGGNRASAERR